MVAVGDVLTVVYPGWCSRVYTGWYTPTRVPGRHTGGEGYLHTHHGTREAYRVYIPPYHGTREACWVYYAPTMVPERHAGCTMLTMVPEKHAGCIMLSPWVRGRHNEARSNLPPWVKDRHNEARSTLNLWENEP